MSSLKFLFCKNKPKFCRLAIIPFQKKSNNPLKPHTFMQKSLGLFYPQAWNSTTGIIIPFKQPAQEQTLVATLELLDKFGVLPKLSSSRKIAESPLFAEKFDEPNSFWLFWLLFCRLNLPIILFTQAEVRLYMWLLSTIQ